ncbi:MAG TPA: hypothetical protein DD638_10720 [Pasteurellaceae bacterium]|nr:hypothetical protein [Pasteurellaceae bacterium]
MKKSAVALGVIVVLGAAWTGGAWFTGKTAEAEYGRQIELVNQEMASINSLSQQGIDVKIENVKFERGLFSSYVSYDTVVKSLIDEQSWIFSFDGKVYHGPLPLDQVSQFNFKPVMFSTTMQMVKNDKTQTWFDATKGKNPVLSNASVGYDRRIKGDLQIAAGEFKLQGVDSSWSDVKIAYDTDKSGKGRYEYDIAKVKALFDREGLEKYADVQQNSNLNSMDIELSTLKGVNDMQPTTFPKILVGSHNINLGSLKYSYTFKDGAVPPMQFEFKNSALNYSVAQKDNFLNYSFKNNVENIDINGHALGQLQFNIQLDHLVAKAMERLIGISPSDNATLEEVGLELLQNQPHLQIAPLALTSPDGKLDLEVNIELSNADLTKVSQGKLLTLFNQLSFQMNADKKAMENIISILQQSEGKSKEESDQLAQQQVAEYVQEAVRGGAVMDSEKSISAKLILENNELKFNGNTVPEEYIGLFLMGLMMR